MREEQDCMHVSGGGDWQIFSTVGDSTVTYECDVNGTVVSVGRGELLRWMRAFPD